MCQRWLYTDPERVVHHCVGVVQAAAHAIVPADHIRLARQVSGEKQAGSHLVLVEVGQQVEVIVDDRLAGDAEQLAVGSQLNGGTGVVQGDVLVLASSTAEGPVVAVSGEARWARLITADGLWALDCAVAVDAEGATAGLVIAGTQAGPNGGALLYKGGRLPAVELALR